MPRRTGEQDRSTDRKLSALEVGLPPSYLVVASCCIDNPKTYLEWEKEAGWAQVEQVFYLLNNEICFLHKPVTIILKV